jgi:glutathione peroxidase
VTFPMTEKVEVNGPARHPVYVDLVQVPDQSGRTGDVQWNFEKFVVDADGSVVARFDPTVVPDDPAVAAAIEPLLR